MFWKKGDAYADPAADCPMWKAPCKKHACRFYYHIQGLNPNTGEDISRWDCAVAWLPLLLMENTRKNIETGASTDKVANEVDRLRQQVVKQNEGVQALLVEHVQLAKQVVIATAEVARELSSLPTPNGKQITMTPIAIEDQS